MITIGITGGTGLIGRHITKLLIDNGYEVIIFSRKPSDSPDKRISQALFDAEAQQCDINAISRLDAIIHLAGEPVAGKRWTTVQKDKIFSSRVNGTRFLVNQLRLHASKCKTILAASAIGYYGADHPGSAPFEEDNPAANDFLGKTSRAWEAAAHAAEDFARVVLLRTGIVLAREGGAFKEFTRTLPFRLLPILSNGNQVISWIHIHDMAKMYLYALENSMMMGAYNAVAPNPVTNKTLMRCIAQTHGGFHLMPHVPAFVLKIALGEMSVEVLKSCTVSANHVRESGFRFRHNDIESAVRDLLSPTE